MGQNLHEAQTLTKKHIKLKAEIEGHKPQITKTMVKGNKLIDENHPEKDMVILYIRYALGRLVRLRRKNSVGYKNLE